MKLSLPGRFGTTSMVVMIVAIGSFACGSTVRNAITTIFYSNQATTLSAHTISDIAWSGDGTCLVTRSRGGSQLNASVTIHDLSDSSQSRSLWYSDYGVSANHATLSCDGDHLLIATSHGELWWIDIETRNVVTVARMPRETFVCTAISHRGNILVGATDDGTIHMFDHCARVTKRLTAAKSPSMVWQLQFTRDDRHLLVACNSGSIYVWDVDSGDLLQARRFDKSGGTAASFLPDGKTVLSSSGPGTISTWDTLTGRVDQTKSHTIGGYYGVRLLDVSSDGSTAVIAGLSHLIEIWDLKGFVKRLEIDNPSVVLGLQLSPDGTQLAVAGRESTIRIYDAATGELKKRVETVPAPLPD